MKLSHAVMRELGKEFPQALVEKVAQWGQDIQVRIMDEGLLSGQAGYTHRYRLLDGQGETLANVGMKWGTKWIESVDYFPYIRIRKHEDWSVADRYETVEKCFERLGDAADRVRYIVYLELHIYGFCVIHKLPRSYTGGAKKFLEEKVAAAIQQRMKTAG